MAASGSVTDEGSELIGVGAPGAVPCAVAVFTMEPALMSAGVTT